MKMKEEEVAEHCALFPFLMSKIPPFNVAVAWGCTVGRSETRELAFGCAAADPGEARRIVRLADCAPSPRRIVRLVRGAHILLELNILGSTI